MTLKEIATKANTSISTVSRVLNNRQPNAASKELSETIWSIALESGYITEEAAKAILSNTSETTPVNEERKSVYILIASSDSVSQEDTFFTDIINGVRTVAYQNGFVLENIFHIDDFTNGTAKTFIQPHGNTSLITVGYCNPREMEDIFGLFDHVLHISLNVLDSDYDQVLCNGFLAANVCLEYLQTLGHTKVAFIGSSKESRFSAYQYHMHNIGESIDENLLITDSDFTMKGGENAMLELLGKNNSLTAVFCMSDRIAIGVMKACEDSNIRVPEDISVIGMNDVEIASFVKPQLTTIHIPLKELGRIAMSTLINRIQESFSLPVQISVPFNLMKRESCTIAKTKE